LLFAVHVNASSLLLHAGKYFFNLAQFRSAVLLVSIVSKVCLNRY